MAKERAQLEERHKKLRGMVWKGVPKIQFNVNLKGKESGKEVTCQSVKKMQSQKSDWRKTTKEAK